MKNELDLNTPLGLALQLNALQMLEDGGNTCGMHPRSIRRNLIARLLDATSVVDAEVPPARSGVDLAAGTDKCVIGVARRGADGSIEIERTIELTGDRRKEFEEMQRELSKRLSSPRGAGKNSAIAEWAKRIEELCFGSDKDVAQAPQGLQHVAESLKMFGGKSDPLKLDDVEFVYRSDQCFEVTLLVDGKLRREQVLASPDEPLDGTIGYMVGSISQKYGTAYGDALLHKLRAWKARRDRGLRSGSVWHDWSGGLGCPALPPGTMVEVTLRGGGALKEQPSNLHWGHTGLGSDIVKYRVLPQTAGTAAGTAQS